MKNITYFQNLDVCQKCHKLKFCFEVVLQYFSIKYHGNISVSHYKVQLPVGWFILLWIIILIIVKISAIMLLYKYKVSIKSIWPVFFLSLFANGHHAKKISEARINILYIETRYLKMVWLTHLLFKFVAVATNRGGDYIVNHF